MLTYTDIEKISVLYFNNETFQSSLKYIKDFKFFRISFETDINWLIFISIPKNFLPGMVKDYIVANLEKLPISRESAVKALVERCLYGVVYFYDKDVLYVCKRENIDGDFCVKISPYFLPKRYFLIKLNQYVKPIYNIDFNFISLISLFLHCDFFGNSIYFRLYNKGSICSKQKKIAQNFGCGIGLGQYKTIY